MSDLELKVRLTGEAGQLVGQLKAVENAEKGVSKEATAMAEAYKRADAAIDELARAQVEAKRETQAAAAALKAGSVSQTEYNRAILQTKAALSAIETEHRKAVAGYNQHAAAAKGVTQSLGAMRASSANLGAQVSDITQSLALGINPFMVFGQQAGQTAAALSGMGGVAGRVATFLSGPFGSLVLAGVTVLGLFATASKDAEKATRDLGDGIDFAKMSTSELIKSIDELEAAQRKSIRTTEEAEEAKLRDARAALKQANDTREATKAMLEGMLVTAQRNAGQGTGGLAGAAAGLSVNELRSQIQQLDASITKAQALVRETQVPILQRQAKAATDGVTNATEVYRRAKSMLDATYVAGNISLENYNAQLRIAEERLKAQTKAARDAEKQTKDTNAAMMGAFGSPLASMPRPSSGFGSRAAPLAGASTNHAGIDLPARTGTPVLATADAVVEFVGKAGGYGNLIRLDHGGGTQTRYGHLSGFNVRDRQQVSKGDVIGYVGNTGNSTGAHLHYEVRVNGKPVDPTKGRFPIDGVQVAEEAQKAQEALQTFGERSAMSIARVTERFAEQPKLVGQVNMAVLDLDSTIADLREKQPPGFEKMIADAEAAKQVVQSSLLKPFNDYLESSERARDVQLLTLAGRQDEAKALETIYQLQERVGFVTKEQREAILANVQAERELNELLAQRQVIVGAYTSAINDVRSNIEGLLSGRVKGGDFLKNIQQSYMDTQAKILTEKLFGPALRDLQKQVEGSNGVQSSVDIMKAGAKDAGNAASRLAGALNGAADSISGDTGGSATTGGRFGGSGFVQSGTMDPWLAKWVQSVQTGGVFDLGGTPGPSYEKFLTEFDRVLGRTTNPAEDATADNTDEIVVVGKKGVMGQSPAQFFQGMMNSVAMPLGNLLSELLGPRFASMISGALGGALGGLATGGTTGGVFGALQGIFGKGAAGGLFDNGLKGAQTGTMVAALGNAFGVNMSQTGSQVGGALGTIGASIAGITGTLGAALGPIGAIVGGLLGGLFKKKPEGMAQIRGMSVTGTYGNNSDLKGAATEAAGGLISSIKDIAEALGGSLGSFNLDYGKHGDRYVVNTNNINGGKVDTKYFSSAEEATKFALADAVRDGAIKGLSAAVDKALRSSGDVEAAVKEAAKVRDLEAILGGFTGAAKSAFEAFEKQAAERLRLATAYGLEITKVEELNLKDRLALREDLEKRAFGSLTDLLDRLRTGDLSEGSAVDKRTALLAEIEKAKVDAADGKDGASDKLANLLEQFTVLSREIYGTTGGYADDRATTISTAENVITLLKANLDEAAGNGVVLTNGLLDENNAQNAMIIAALMDIRNISRAQAVESLTPAVPVIPTPTVAQQAYTSPASALPPWLWQP